MVGINKVTMPKATKYSNLGNALAEEAGKQLYEAFKAKGQLKVLQEKFGATFKEEMNTTTAAGSYTTLLSGVLYQAAADNIQQIMDLVFVNEDLKNKGGFGAYQIPRQQNTIAYEVAEGAVVNYFTEGIDSVTVTPRKVVVGTAITWEIMKRGMTDMAKFTLNQAANAITRKLATDICNGLAAGADSTNTVTGGVDYNAVIDAETNVNSATDSNSVPYGHMADKLVFSSTAYGTIQKDADWKQHVFRAPAAGGELVINKGALKVSNMEIVTTPFLSSALAMALDSSKAAMLVKESDLETFEGQINGRPYDREVVGLMSYVLAVIYPSAIAKITA